MANPGKMNGQHATLTKKDAKRVKDVEKISVSEHKTGIQPPPHQKSTKSLTVSTAAANVPAYSGILQQQARLKDHSFLMISAMSGTKVSPLLAPVSHTIYFIFLAQGILSK